MVSYYNDNCDLEISPNDEPVAKGLKQDPEHLIAACSVQLNVSASNLLSSSSRNSQSKNEDSIGTDESDYYSYSDQGWDNADIEFCDVDA